MKNSTALPVKQIAEFDSTEGEPKLLRRPAFWFGFIVFLGIALCSALLASVKLGVGDQSWFFAASFAVACLGGTRIVYLYAEAKAKRGQVYDQYLATISPDLLTIVAASPEFDQETKDAVIKHLNIAHPGWSLA